MGVRDRVEVLEEWADELDSPRSVPKDVVETLAAASGVPAARVAAIWQDVFGSQAATADGLTDLIAAMSREPGFSPGSVCELRNAGHRLGT